MIKICWSIDNICKYQRSELPVNARKLSTPSSVEEMMKAALPICIILCFLCAGIMFAKTFIARQVCVNPFFITLGFAIGFVLLLVHEWLHGIVYPKDANVTIGKMKGKLTFVALASYPLKRDRFIVMSLLPFVLGIVPLICFVISNPDNVGMNGLLFGMACMGMASPFPDVYNVYSVLKQTKKDNKIVFYEDDIYSIS